MPTPTDPSQPQPPHGPLAPHGARFAFDRSLAQLKKRLVSEATAAFGMLEGALEALWRLDAAAAKEVRRRDDGIDAEEVQIEAECFRLLALEQPMARDLRVITFILKVNADIERVADHASSIAKIATRMDTSRPPRWPTALVEMGQRVPVMCHLLMRAVLDEDAELARQVVDEDETIDRLERRLFEEVEDLLRKEPEGTRNGLLIYRAGRELERIGDLMKNIGEDVIYLSTGSIVRHEQKRAKHAAEQAGQVPRD
ncbi:MAG: phosphate signaling complex protein PhoU [Phycisphaeraceae bacterium]|nr:phosphate signaling complex protein PhoU [Phycisphaeraceae bacterium]